MANVNTDSHGCMMMMLRKQRMPEGLRSVAGQNTNTDTDTNTNTNTDMLGFAQFSAEQGPCLLRPIALHPEVVDSRSFGLIQSFGASGLKRRVHLLKGGHSILQKTCRHEQSHDDSIL